MTQADIKAGLETRLKDLAAHIAELKRALNRPTTHKQLAGVGEIEALERRYIALDAKLSQINHPDPSVQQDTKADIDSGVDEMTQWIREHMAWIDSGYHPDLRPKRLD